ncbi:hypothetical protein CR513_20738, partial [Mucuna pruriens]
MRLLQEQTSTTIILNHHASNNLRLSASSFDCLRNCLLVDSGASTHIACSLQLSNLSMDPFPPITKVFLLLFKKRSNKKLVHLLLVMSLMILLLQLLQITKEEVPRKTTPFGPTCYKFQGYPYNYKKNKVSSESVNQVSIPSTTPYF